jgi:hypothetical protein
MHRIGMLVVVVLVGLNVYLVPMAFRNAGTSPSDDEGGSQATRQPAATTPASPNETADPEPMRDGPLLLASAQQTVIRAARGRCEGPPPLVERSTNGGARFSDVTLPEGVSEVLAVEALSPRRIGLTALDDACEPVRYVSNNRGGDWRKRPADGHWSRGSERRQVLSPNGPIDVPCAPVDMSSVRDDYVRVLCPDGRVLRTWDDQNWTVASTIEGAQAIRFPVPDIGYALASDGDCTSAVMQTTDSGVSWNQIACLEGEPPRAITGQDGRYVAQAGDVLQVSTDGGVTWSRP